MFMKEIILRPVTSEKSVRLMESDNKLTLIVNRNANKQKIKKAVEDLFNVKVVKVNTLNTPSNEKKAFVKLSSDDIALDIGAELGMI
ncbi:50S ribosomal protein L23 [archaeon]|nr:50S ribosomal protein L23 [archaeon]